MTKAELIEKYNKLQSLVKLPDNCTFEEFAISEIISQFITELKQLDEPPTEPCAFCRETHYCGGKIFNYAGVEFSLDLRYDDENKMLDLMLKGGGCVISEYSLIFKFCPKCGRKL
jgi:hypothetical protein